MSKINVGIIGAGRFGQLHLKSYNDSGLTNITAICGSGRNPEKTAKTAQQFNAKCYNDYHDFLEDQEVEAVSVCVPAHIQADKAIDAINAGKHVMLEKPIATTLEDAYRIKEAADKSDKVIMVGYVERYNPSLRRVKKLITENHLGELFRISIKRGSRFSMRVPWAWETGMFVHMLGHNIDILRWLLNDEVERVYVESDSFMHKVKGEDDNICVLIRFKKGAIAVSEDCWTLPGNFPTEELDMRMDLVGTEGSLVLDNTNQMISMCNTEKGWYFPGMLRWPGGVEEDSGMESYALKDELTHFIRCINDPSLTPVGSVDDAIINLKVSIACEKSAREGRPINIDEMFTV